MAINFYILVRSIILGLAFTLLAMLIAIYQRHRAKIEKLAIFLQLSIVIGFLISLINLLIPSLIIFQVTIIIGFITYILFIYVFFTLLEGSGETRPKRERMLLMIYSIGLVIFMVIFAFFQVTSITLPDGLVSYGLELNLIIIPAILMFLPFLHMIMITRRFFQKLYEKEMRATLNLFYILLFNYLTFSYIFLFIIHIRLIAGFILIGTEVCFILFLKFNHNFMAQIHSTFAYKRVFIIRNNGQTIYTYDFDPDTKLKEINTVKYLIGGFIYAITHGIKEIVKQEYEATLRSMNFGKIKMLFYYGTHVFGVLFSREANAVIFNRLQRFVNGFEETFSEIVGDPTTHVILNGITDGEKDPELSKEINALLQLYFKF